MNKEALKLSAILSRSFPDKPAHLIADDVAALYRVAKTLQSYAESACNRQLTANEEARQESCRAQIQRIAARYGVPVSVHGDPRGYLVKLQLPGRESNELGGDYGIG